MIPDTIPKGFTNNQPPIDNDPIEIIEIDDDDDDIEEIDDIDVDVEDGEANSETLHDDSHNAVSKPLLASDFKSTAIKMLKPIPDYPVKQQCHYVWQIKNWSSLSDEKVRSPVFSCGGFNWNILLLPRGNNGGNSISVYMEPHPIPNPDTNEIDPDWYVCAQFALDVWNPAHPQAHFASASYHRFNKNETDWGFSSFLDMKLLQTPSPRFGTAHAILENNQLNITGYVKVIDDSSTGVLWHSFTDYDSKKHTGYVGLNNQGATCYLNSLLQSYFTTSIFRKLVYQIPTDQPASTSSTSVPLSLQRIFYLLSTSQSPVGTMELTKSFGWDSSDAFTQHDVQELNRILMDKLETAMKGTAIENSLNGIFVGKMKSYIKCVNVDYESSRIEDFWDIQLNVRGFKNLQQSFQNYIEIEMLDGENKYQAGDEYGYQDAKKGVVFESFPPVLHLQLKRFEYNFMVDDLVKIDDFYEFPDSIDLKPYLDEELPDEIRNQNWTYKLHGVLVHQGSVSNGHYYAMTKPGHKDEWLRFDDDKVWKATPTQVFQENYGANEISPQQFAKLTRAEQQENVVRRVTSAYMLVYYRESELDKILPADESSIDLVIPEHIPNQIKYELEEQERLENLRQEALYYTNVKFITIDNFINFAGFDIVMDPTIPKFYDESLLGTPAEPATFKIKKNDSYLALNKLIGTKLGYLSEDDNLENDENLPFRLLITSHRNNHTIRTDTPINEEYKELNVNSLYFKVFNKKFDEMVFYVEEINKDIRNINSVLGSSLLIKPEEFKFDNVADKIHKTGKTVDKKARFKNISEFSNYILIFIKYFDPVSQKVQGLSHIVVSKDDLVESIIEPVNEFLGFDKNTNLQLFEELSPLKIESIEGNLTFEKHELSNGDIITVQVANAKELANGQKFGHVRDYYRFLFSRLHIEVKPYKAEVDEEDSDFVADGNEEKNGNATNGIEHSKPRNSKPISMWVSTLYTYQELASEIAKKLDGDINPDFLKIFVVNHQGQRYPLKTHYVLSQLFPKPIPVNQTVTFEYEVLNINLKEYENLKAVKIHWLTSLLQYQVFELLVPKDGTVSDMMAKLLHKVNIPRKDWKHILVWSGNNHTYHDLVKFNQPLESIQDGFDLYAGVFPVEVEILGSHDLFKRYVDEPVKIDEIDNEAVKKEMLVAKKYAKSLNMIPAFHFYKSSNYHHGIPFVLPVYPEETLEQTKERLRRKLGLGIQAFEKIRFALADNEDKGAYIDADNSDIILFDEVNKSGASVSFALDHPDRTPRRQAQFDKGISIK